MIIKNYTKYLKMFIIGILTLFLTSCQNKTEEKINNSIQNIVQEENKNIVIAENLELYEGIVIKRMLLLKENGKNLLQFEFKSNDIKKLEEYNLKIHARPTKYSEQQELKSGFQNWDISLNSTLKSEGEYYVATKEIEPKYNEYELNLALYKIQKEDDGVIKYPNFGNQLFIKLEI